ncbi:MAG: CoA-transferase [Chloroflexota bacterium]|nr:CoA-transferase [Chloroflexota bacterium]
MIDKVVDLKGAASLVRDGDILSLGGMLLYRRPVAFVGELLRQGTSDLTIMGMTAAFESDLLVGAGRVRRVRTCYFGLEGFGLAPMFTAAAQEGRIEVTEESEASIAWGVRAALAGVGFMPSSAWRGTDLASVRPDVQSIACPYTGETLMAFPALRPNVAVIHAVMADRAGNAVLVGNLALDADLALCADRVVVTAERVVDTSDLLGDLAISSQLVDAVVECPHGAWPTSCYPSYPLGSNEIMDYVEACAGGDFDGYLARFLAGSRDSGAKAAWRP